MKRPRRAQNNRVLRSEDYLKDVEALQVVLESGKTVSFRMHEELAIPDGPDELVEAARQAAERFAFWSYQTERALVRVRELERKVAHLEGEMNLVYRKWYWEHTDEQIVTESMVRSRVDTDTDVAKWRTRLDKAREQYGILRSMRDAMEHRIYILRRLCAD